MRKIIVTDRAPQAIGPYSQAYQCGNLLFTSGQLPITSEGNIVEGDVTDQVHQVLKNAREILKEGNATLKDVIKVTIFIKDMEQFSLINDVYALYFGDHKPARSCVEVSRLPKDVQIEIEMLAIL